MLHITYLQLLTERYEHTIFKKIILQLLHIIKMILNLYIIVNFYHEVEYLECMVYPQPL